MTYITDINFRIWIYWYFTNIKFVIDSGFFKMRKFFPKLNIDTLKVTKISKNSALQRAGRTGREAPGVCYRLYTQKDYNNFEDNIEPEIIKQLI